MSKFNIAAAFVALAMAFAPAAASAQYKHGYSKKCYHCYYTKYGKKVCHNDCKCKGRH